MNDVKTELFVGTHEFRFVPPDQIHFVMRGEFKGAHVDPYFDFVFSHGESTGGLLYSVYDLSEFTRATESGRKRVINPGRLYPYAALAVIGASFSTRTVAKMILRAGKLVAPKHFNFPIKFVSTMDDAQAWFDELRRKRA
ncbi:MAG: hypothetical protein IPM54_03770 [Polyangiaceae bacterium]|nr:hypothetical protein [Polyangiaceae bacterium]